MNLIREAKAIRRQRYHALMGAQQLAYDALHRSIRATLTGRDSRVPRSPFELYDHSANQLTLDETTPDDVLVAEYRR